MNKFTLLLTVLFVFMCFSAFADEAEAPSVGSLNSITEGDVGDHLDYLCIPQSDGLHCHFDQNIIIKEENAYFTCRISHYSFDEVLTKKADGLWVQSSGPKGTCGVVDNSRFVRVSSGKNLNLEIIWNYFTQQTFTINTGSSAYGSGFISCEKAKESGAEKEMAYVPPVKSEYLGCLFIKH